MTGGTLKVYVLKNCDTCRKAVKWLDKRAIPYVFYDVRKDGVSRADIARWAKAVGWEVLLNKAGTTWRGLPDKRKQGLDEGLAVALMAEHVALIKRPVFDLGSAVLVGFKEAQRQALERL